jgi:hypothetical protein
MAREPSSLGRRLGRTLRLGMVTTRASTGWATASLLGSAGGRAAARALLRSSSAHAAATLGRMKGLAMKVGQYLSFALPDLPPELAEALATLQTRSAPRPFGPIAALVEAELGRPLGQAFAARLPRRGALAGPLRGALRRPPLRRRPRGLPHPLHRARAHHRLGRGPGLRRRPVRSQPVRSAHGEVLLRFLLGNLLGAGELPADPHPGNYRFDARGERTTFLDFGCVKLLPPEVQAGLRALFRAALDGDGEAERRAAERLGVVDAGGSRAVAEALAGLYVPFRLDAAGPFPAPLSSASLRAAAGPDLAETRRSLRIPGDLPFVSRTVVGLYAVLARLGAVAPWRRIAREYACGDLPATPLGEAERRWRAARPVAERFPRP